MSSYRGPSMVKPMMNNDAANASESGHRIVKLAPQGEIRIQVHQSSTLKLRVLEGKVEIFGSELPPKVWITFPPLQQFAVFTWYGGTIEVDGVTETEYTSSETPMMSYLNFHNSLQRQRHRVTSSTSDNVSSHGPRVIIVGDIDSGKTTLAKMILSWAAKDGFKPTFVDLNVGQSSITIPGTIAATSIEMPLDPVEGFPINKALVHYFGHTTPDINLRLYKALVEELARELEVEFSDNIESRYSGMVIDTMGWTTGVGYHLLVHAIRRFNASVVIVLGQETELVNDLSKALRFKKNLQILNLEKSAGVFSRGSDFRKTLRNNNIKKYYHGATHELTVYTKTAKFRDVQVYQFPKRSRGNHDSTLEITPVKIDEQLINKVLAISYAKEPDQIISSIVAGFVCITNVDIDEERITYLSPSAAELPSKILVTGTLTWHVT
ncbi:LOW QUALITY PROTEIN: protein CLP1 homolog 5 [Eutrema salsugineum]|uniref:LOW QUALITY PROTEIN: protein CLP1 homolog 5 n=1 Tax=Eutrema salsugineum TaxID=72664 RepID=UPI000CED5B99|nr:LOW QUALITY PROTEIN: protein CLP1 homolog 5 [Eutrema salsugineum]